MNAMHGLDESHLLLFLVQLTLLVGLSRLFGMLLQRYGQPSITAEILVGVLLGPTIFGRLLPAAHATLFPSDPIQIHMLDTVAWLGIFFFLLHTGLETDFGTAWRQRREALLISFSDLIVPIIVAFVPCLFLPDFYLADPSRRLLFAFFVSTILTISALPATARVLQDLDIYRTDVGLMVMGALTINDVAGWVIFAIILGFAGEAGMTAGYILWVLCGTVAFAAIFLTVGKRITNRAFEQFQRWRLPEPGASLTFISILGFVGGALTIKIGIHALFGFFIAGTMAGEARALSENTRQVIAQMVRALLVPVFFASLGLRIDFLASFDVFLVFFLLALGVAGRYFGAWIGVALARHSKANRGLISAAHVPGGEMQIVVGLLALEVGVITETVFVAIVIGAVITCIILGPWMRWSLRRTGPSDVARYFAPETMLPVLQSRDREGAIRELSRLAASHLRMDEALIAEAVLDRERAMGTALGEEAAVPHARLGELAAPMVAVGRSMEGIPWNAPDGRPAHLIFLVLTKTGDDESQIRILRSLARVIRDPAAHRALAHASHPAQMWLALKTAFGAQSPGPIA